VVYCGPRNSLTGTQASVPQCIGPTAVVNLKFIGSSRRLCRCQLWSHVIEFADVVLSSITFTVVSQFIL
jgi:hypothetical protein